MEEIQLILARNLKQLREKEKLSLEKLSQLSGVSKTMIGQIERGESSPTITTIWKIANGLKVSFSSLIDHPQPESKVILREDVGVVIGDSGRYKVFPLFPFDEEKRFEIYSVEIEKEGKTESPPHKEGTEEYITVYEGEVTISLNEEIYLLKTGDSMRFKADRHHTYFNSGDILTKLSMAIYYPT
ncbi:helix-turn-helix domain-containing protein [Alkalicoccobacillus plakortidis]|uniref:XRE family transcriptional regulator n=1 Tax=Alkalicoccobacillus plakortidis TaxID=444060 RepID=A0ABT0XE88_9BACI|nr:XRE family transcriptional regulator [Alkalicoccobacillus plakortidis]MCM2674169.1 XRE family transcriptional regulator [Alkalicoccobacillus plakortidis]